MEVSSLFHHVGPRESNSDHQAWLQGPLPTEPSCLSMVTFKIIFSFFLLMLGIKPKTLDMVGKIFTTVISLLLPLKRVRHKSKLKFKGFYMLYSRLGIWVLGLFLRPGFSM